MTRKILYYPTILVPTKWLKWAILYWDKVSSIVPKYWEDIRSFWNPQDNEFYEAMKYLEQEEEYEPIKPRTFDAFSTLTEEFKEIVNSSQFQSRINRTKVGFINKDKITDSIYDFLREKDLISENRTNWFIIEENTALLYLSLLAKYLADSELDYTIPGTDLKVYETMIYRASEVKHGFPSWDSKFLNVLPVPRDEVALRDIITFKRKRKSELLQFREVIDEIERDISQAESEKEIKRLLAQYRDKIKSKASKLNSEMKDLNIKTTLATFKSLIDIKSPVLWEALLSIPLEIPPQISVPIVGTTAAIQVGYAWIDNKNRQRAKLRESSYSYLYYARRKRVV